jgi:hypothetical protein
LKLLAAVDLAERQRERDPLVLGQAAVVVLIPK